MGVVRRPYNFKHHSYHACSPWLQLSFTQILQLLALCFLLCCSLLVRTVLLAVPCRYDTVSLSIQFPCRYSFTQILQLLATEIRTKLCTMCDVKLKFYIIIIVNLHVHMYNLVFPSHRSTRWLSLFKRCSRSRY